MADNVVINTGLSNGTTETPAGGHDGGEVEKYLWNGHKSRIVSSGLLNTSALSSNATLLAILLKQDSLDTYSRVSLCLVIVSVIIQVVTGFMLALEYRSTITGQNSFDASQEETTQAKAKKSQNNTLQMVNVVSVQTANRDVSTPGNCKVHGDSLFCWAKPMEYQFASIILLMLLNIVNTFVVAFVANINVYDTSVALVTASNS